MYKAIKKRRVNPIWVNSNKQKRPITEAFLIFLSLFKHQIQIAYSTIKSVFASPSFD